MNRLQLYNENTRGITGWGVEIHDLIPWKYASGREKDLGFNAQVIALELVSQKRLLEWVGCLEVSNVIKDQIRLKIRADFLQSQPVGENS